jgi:predicted negative regulator of RcsB-dependent stress response
VLGADGDLERLAGEVDVVINVEFVDVLNFIGSVLLEDGQKDKAWETFAKSLKIKSDQPLVRSIIKRIGQ